MKRYYKEQLRRGCLEVIVITIICAVVATIATILTYNAGYEDAEKRYINERYELITRDVSYYELCRVLYLRIDSLEDINQKLLDNYMDVMNQNVKLKTRLNHESK